MQDHITNNRQQNNYVMCKNVMSGLDYCKLSEVVTKIKQIQS